MKLANLRTCFICRVSEKKTELLRLIYQDGKVILDTKKSLGKRGGWVHPNCLKNGVSKKNFHFAFRLSNEEMKSLDYSGLMDNLDNNLSN